MDSTKEDVKAIAERMADDAFPWDKPTSDVLGVHNIMHPREGARRAYAHCAEALLPHILSLMARVKHEHGCERWRWNHGENLGRAPLCDCGLDAELKSIESLIRPTT